MSGCDSDSDWSDAPELEEDEIVKCRSLFSLFEGSVEECLASDKRVFGWSLGSNYLSCGLSIEFR